MITIDEKIHFIASKMGAFYLRYYAGEEFGYNLSNKTDEGLGASGKEYEFICYKSLEEMVSDAYEYFLTGKVRDVVQKAFTEMENEIYNIKFTGIKIKNIEIRGGVIVISYDEDDDSTVDFDYVTFYDFIDSKIDRAFVDLKLDMFN